ncbi:hypothetical protein TRFO_38847 [Tritrichomonas foetus]|uniref:Uncharacterized protein n=1 Tax=Tritrichomonas foetus TaxID=1144522 RepID=A0A1J4J717_9EUKA|nr:hypothetical protein TRFO_38847 [Tritrichomonas foetus]|eukprot:OHS94960.1 hypothetical protein TRFO_38847 [Tritrichomonas foetus]
MKKSIRSKIGGPNSALRQINIRKYYENTYKQHRSFSDPFIHDYSDSSEPESQNPVARKRKNSKSGKCDDLDFTNFAKKLKLKFDYQTDSSDDYFDFFQNGIDKDGILIKPDLDEADKFIASLKIHKKNINLNRYRSASSSACCSGQESQCESPALTKPWFGISRSEIDAFQAESEKLQKLLNEEAEDEDEKDFDLI